ncbi:ATP-dependent DNA helicase [Hondaea fermentalgiana]|uniref:ATP-dependent DNA helicase n=1 Tax=Hondaea fermentalgiana TaxID=2315210 RepID=A0A2R5GBP1_9STRA|nr:ATP-dependent DNA helicase [Hondaea fermentalgiana]|eukprot:GBG27138.1 ATP-dependent DNA helicase [Hondaea fermentalgiana]
MGPISVFLQQTNPEPANQKRKLAYISSRGNDPLTAGRLPKMTATRTARPADSLSRRQKCCLRAAQAGRHLFVTGGAGCGKSTAARSIVDALREQHGADKVAVTAPTGLAAANFTGASSLHQFAGVGLARGSKERLAASVRGNSAARRRWSRCKVLVIDEVSQLSATLLDMLNFVARKVRPAKLGKRAFGGIQLVLVGDFAQLPPVDADHGFAFESETWSQIFSREQGCIVNLDRCFRINDTGQSVFLDCLNQIRRGDLTPQAADWLRKNCPARAPRTGQEPTYLCSRNAQVNSINESHLRRLADKGVLVREFYAEDSPNNPALEAAIDHACRLPRVLRLAMGVPVVLLVNLDARAGLVNGLRGTVVGFERPVGLAVENVDLVPLVKFCVAGGDPLSSVRVDLDGVFSVGQVYTALTRTSSHSNLEIENLDENCVCVHPKVMRFHQALFGDDDDDVDVDVDVDDDDDDEKEEEDADADFKEKAAENQPVELGKGGSTSRRTPIFVENNPKRSNRTPRAVSFAQDQLNSAQAKTNCSASRVQRDPGFTTRVKFSLHIARH